MEPAIYQSSIGAVWADALFVSVLQRCDRPSAGQVQQAVAAAVGVFGPLGCAERVAQEFGDHPEAAVTRMRWARTLAAKAMGGPGAGRCQRPITGQGGAGRPVVARNRSIMAFTCSGTSSWTK
jgi:hypothetical protein